MFTSTQIAVFGLAALSSAHVKMSSPTPFGQSTLDNSPLKDTGADFPCKQRTGVYDAEGASNTWPLGSTQSLAFVGSAVHGGGSCQVSVTYDEAPTASSTWKVIHSIEGGCPMKGVAGNNGDNAAAIVPDTYDFTVPSSLPTGTAVMAWTWFNKIGNREMYMNCAPITITSGSSKRSDEDELLGRNVTQLIERDTAAFDALPNMFVANIPVDSCRTVETQDLAFPDPGDSLDLFGTATATPAGPVGASCGASGGSPVATGGASSAAASTPKTTQKATTSAAGIPGGVFATVPTSAAAGEATAAPVVSAAPVASQAPVASSVASSAAPAASSGTSSGTTGSGTAEVAGSACTTEGMWNCIGGTSFQQCASGTWSVVQSLAAGTTCSAGESTAINITASTKAKRAIRFSGEHIRRHIHKS